VAIVVHEKAKQTTRHRWRVCIQSEEANVDSLEKKIFRGTIPVCAKKGELEAKFIVRVLILNTGLLVVRKPMA
jgi:hypothetical protein